MKVAAIIATETVSGPGRQLAAVAAPLRDAGVDLHVLVLSRDPRQAPPYTSYLAQAGVAHTVIPDRGPADWRIVTEVSARLHQHGAEIIQTHGYKATAVGRVLRRRTPARPWVAYYHGATQKGMRDRVYQAVERRLLGRADRVVIVSETQRRIVGNLPQLTVIANAVLPEFLAPSNVGTLPEGMLCGPRPRIGVIGRLSREKGVDVFLRACAELLRQSVQFSAYIIGDGPEEAPLRSLSHGLGLEDSVRFVGRAESLPAIYRELDLVVLPSRSEGLPNVLLEALAADRPVVATAVGAIPYVLAEPEAGALVEPGNVPALAAAIMSAIRDGQPATASTARAAVVKRYSIERRVSEHLRMYREIAAAQAPVRVSS
jgi:glycosyltransferase involved in cell wall biosynthesis